MSTGVDDVSQTALTKVDRVMIQGREFGPPPNVFDAIEQAIAILEGMRGMLSHHFPEQSEKFRAQISTTIGTLTRALQGKQDIPVAAQTAVRQLDSLINALNAQEGIGISPSLAAQLRAQAQLVQGILQNLL